MEVHFGYLKDNSEFPKDTQIGCLFLHILIKLEGVIL